MLSIEEVKQNLITSDIKLVSYSSTITMMHGPICIRWMKLRCFVERFSGCEVGRMAHSSVQKVLL